MYRNFVFPCNNLEQTCKTFKESSLKDQTIQNYFYSLGGNNIGPLSAICGVLNRRELSSLAVPFRVRFVSVEEWWVWCILFDGVNCPNCWLPNCDRLGWTCFCSKICELCWEAIGTCEYLWCVFGKERTGSGAVTCPYWWLLVTATCTGNGRCCTR